MMITSRLQPVDGRQLAKDWVLHMGKARAPELGWQGFMGPQRGLTECERHAVVEDFWTASRTSLAATASRTPSAFSRAAARAALADCRSERGF